MKFIPIDFAPVVFAIVMSVLGLGFIKVLVFLRDRPHPQQNRRPNR